MKTLATLASTLLILLSTAAATPQKRMIQVDTPEARAWEFGRVFAHLPLEVLAPDAYCMLTGIAELPDGTIVGGVTQARALVHAHSLGVPCRPSPTSRISRARRAARRCSPS